MSFDENPLWKSAFSQGGKAHQSSKQYLSAAYNIFWRNTTELSRTIQATLPELTLHDERHFKALWHRASLLVGSTRKMNPLEAFVLGGAILLHDSGHAVVTYSGGLTELQQTPQWRDNLALALRALEGAVPTKQMMDNPPLSVQKKVVFDTIRAIHAHRAKDLSNISFKHPATQQDMFLIDDTLIRTHLGEIIGIIAASHHWNIEQIRTQLPDQIGSIAGMPDEWTVDPLYIACVLRCADAIQIDQDRTPDFLYAMLQLSGVSETHWRAQNRLAAPAPDRHEKTLLSFASTRAFGPEDADAWWLAYDAIGLADAEIRRSNAFLSDFGRPRLAISGIRHANSPDRLASSVRTVGWRPISASLKISNVQHVISVFGGKALYGEDYTVPLRELLQNASDAVRARRLIEPKGSGYRGRIVVSLTPDDSTPNGAVWLSVEDNGIGMSERTLTGPLLDFGTSFWQSELVISEFPGLAGKTPRQTGRYGVGFFSVFMASKKIIVDSRRYDQGLDKQRSLRFEDGLSLRPLLLDFPQKSLSSVSSTRVSLLLTPDMLNEILCPQNDRIPVCISLEQLIARLCPMVDCDVFVGGLPGQDKLIHSEDWHRSAAEDWLSSIYLANHEWFINQGPKKYKNVVHSIQRQSEFLSNIEIDGLVVGRASIDFTSFRGLRSMGGLLVANGDSFWYDFDDGYVGCIEQAPSGPRRGAGVIAEDLSAWASAQADLLAKAELNSKERQRAAINVAHHGGDATPLAVAFVDRQIYSLSEIVSEFLKDGKHVMFPIEESNYGLRIQIQFDGVILPNNLNVNWGILKFDEAIFAPGMSWLPTASSIWGPIEQAYYGIPKLGHEAGKDAEKGSSFLSCLIRMARMSNVELALELDEAAMIGRRLDNGKQIFAKIIRIRKK